jgi:hypothetical protein
MPAEDFSASAWLPDAALAEVFVAPLDPVARRRDDAAGSG